MTRRRFTATPGERAPGSKARRVYGGPTYVRKPVQSIGRNTGRLYCPGCGLLRSRCICDDVNHDRSSS